MTTRNELVNTLAAIERALAGRTHVWRAIVDAKGNVVRRIYRGSSAPGRRGTTPRSGGQV